MPAFSYARRTVLLRDLVKGLFNRLLRLKICLVDVMMQSSPIEDGFDLGKNRFDRVVLGTVGKVVDDLDIKFSTFLSELLVAMGFKIIHKEHERNVGIFLPEPFHKVYQVPCLDRLVERFYQLDSHLCRY